MGTKQQYASVYTPLSRQDIEKAQRKRLGMVKDVEPEQLYKFARVVKTRCQHTEFCTVCCEPLSLNKVKTLKDGMKAIVSDEIIAIVEGIFFDNPDRFT